MERFPWIFFYFCLKLGVTRQTTTSAILEKRLDSSRSTDQWQNLEKRELHLWYEAGTRENDLEKQVENGRFLDLAGKLAVKGPVMLHSRL